MISKAQRLAQQALPKKVVVTGLGCLNPLGIGVEQTYKSILDNKVAMYNIPPEGYVYGFDSVGSPLPKEAYSDEFKQANRLPTDDIFFAQTHAIFKEAIGQSGLYKEGEGLQGNPDRVGISLASYMDIYERVFYLDKLSKKQQHAMLASQLRGELGRKYGIRGYQGTNVNACSASLMCVGDSFRLIRDGYQDAMITGGFDRSIGTFNDYVFYAMGAFAEDLSDPGRYLKAFDSCRAGTCSGDGGAFFVLESEEHALARGAKPLLEVVGYHSSCYGEDIVKPSRMGIQKLLQNLIKQTGWEPHQIDHINCHATGTPLGDPVETMAVKTVLGTSREDHLKGEFATEDKLDLSKLKNTTLNSLKGYFGHMVVSAGASELVMTMRAMLDNTVLATAHLESPIDPDINFALGKQHQHKEVTRAAKIALGFSANNSALAFEKYSA